MEQLHPDDPSHVGGYELTARLGAGSMGRVFLARDPSGRPLAVKVIHARFARRPHYRERLAREVAAARKVGSVFTAPLVDHDAGAEWPWLATGYLPGPTLRQAVDLHGPLPGPAVRSLGVALAKALAVIHLAGVLHRDLKPSNIILTPAGPRVIDFGIARPEGADTLTAPGVLLGTPGYLAPELMTEGRVGPPGDMFGMGAVLVFAATGASPYGEGSAPVLLHRTRTGRPDLDAFAAATGDAALTGVVRGCLALDPGQRPRPHEVLDRLTGAAEPVREPEGTGWLPDRVATAVERGAATPLPAPKPRAPWTRRAVIGAGFAAVGMAALRSGGPDAEGSAHATTRTPPANRAAQPPVWTHSSFDGPKGNIGLLFRRATAVGDVRLSASGGRSDMVYISSNMGLTALDPDTGNLLWTHYSGPVSGGVAVRREPYGTYLHFTDLWLRELDAAYGTPWNPKRPRPEIHNGGTPVVHRGRLHVADIGGRLHTFDVKTGKPLWSRQLGQLEIGGGPAMVLSGDSLYVTAGGLHAIAPDTGEVRWSFPEATAEPAVSGGTVFTAGADHVHALAARDGRKVWSTRVGSGNLGGLAVAGNVVFAGDETGRLHALDRSAGRPRWNLTTGGSLRGTPVAADGIVYVGADADRLYAVRISDAAVRWSHPVGRQAAIRPVVWKHLVIACLELNRVSAFDRGRPA